MSRQQLLVRERPRQAVVGAGSARARAAAGSAPPSTITGQSGTHAALRAPTASPEARSTSRSAAARQLARRRSHGDDVEAARRAVWRSRKPRTARLRLCEEKRGPWPATARRPPTAAAPDVLSRGGVTIRSTPGRTGRRRAREATRPSPRRRARRTRSEGRRAAWGSPPRRPTGVQRLQHRAAQFARDLENRHSLVKLAAKRLGDDRRRRPPDDGSRREIALHHSVLIRAGGSGHRPRARSRSDAEPSADTGVLHVHGFLRPSVATVSSRPGRMAAATGVPSGPRPKAARSRARRRG